MTRLLDLPTARSTAHRYRAALILGCLSTFVAMLAYAGPLGNAVVLDRELAAGPQGAIWILSAMSAGLATSLLVVGILADDYGRRRVFRWGAVVFAIGAVLAAASTDVLMFVVGRVVQGAGAAGLIATAVPLINAAGAGNPQPARTARWWGATMGAGIAVGPVLTGVLDLASAWRLFYAGLAVAALLVAAAGNRVFSAAPGTRPRRPDLLGFGLLLATLTCLLTGLVELRGAGGGVAWILFIAAALFGAGLVASQLRRTVTLLDVALFRHRPFIGVTVAGFATGAGVIALMSFCCTFLITELSLSSLQAGLVLAVWSGTSALTAIASGRRSGSVGPGRLIVGLVGVSAGLLLLLNVSAPVSPAELLPGLLVTGAATGVLNGSLAAQSVATVPADRTAMGAAANYTVRYLGASIGVTVISVLAHPQAGAVAGWRLVAALSAGISLVGAVAVAVLTAGSARHQGRCQ